MTLTISLSDEDVAILDRFAKDAGLESRSAAIQRATRMLGDPQLEADHAAAWDEWEATVTSPTGSRQLAMAGRMISGEIRLVDVDPVQGREASKRRPAGLVSNDLAKVSAVTRGRGVVTVVPLTSNVARVLPFQVLLRSEQTALPVDSKAQVEQIRSVSARRLGGVIGRVPLRLMAAIDEALRVHLQLGDEMAGRSAVQAIPCAPDLSRPCPAATP